MTIYLADHEHQWVQDENLKSLENCEVENCEWRRYNKLSVSPPSYICDCGDDTHLHTFKDPEFGTCSYLETCAAVNSWGPPPKRTIPSLAEDGLVYRIINGQSIMFRSKDHELYKLE